MNIASGERAEIYIRIRTDTHISFPARFYGPVEFGAEPRRTNLSHVASIVLFIVCSIFQVRLNPGVSGAME